jgi:hypothetical protein
MGILSGGTMGAGAAGYRGFKDKQIDDAAANARNAAANAPARTLGKIRQPLLPPCRLLHGRPRLARLPRWSPAQPRHPRPMLQIWIMKLPGAAPEAQGNEIDFTRDFPAPEWGTELVLLASRLPRRPRQS